MKTPKWAKDHLRSQGKLENILEQIKDGLSFNKKRNLLEEKYVQYIIWNQKKPQFAARYVLAIQASLYYLGCGERFGNIIWGDKSRRALKKFQKLF